MSDRRSGHARRPGAAATGRTAAKRGREQHVESPNARQQKQVKTSSPASRGHSERPTSASAVTRSGRSGAVGRAPLIHSDRSTAPAAATAPEPSAAPQRDPKPVSSSSAPAKPLSSAAISMLGAALHGSPQARMKGAKHTLQREGRKKDHAVLASGGMQRDDAQASPRDSNTQAAPDAAASQRRLAALRAQVQESATRAAGRDDGDILKRVTRRGGGAAADDAAGSSSPSRRLRREVSADARAADAASLGHFLPARRHTPVDSGRSPARHARTDGGTGVCSSQTDGAAVPRHGAAVARTPRVATSAPAAAPACIDLITPEGAFAVPPQPAAGGGGGGVAGLGGPPGPLQQGAAQAHGRAERHGTDAGSDHDVDHLLQEAMHEVAAGAGGTGYDTARPRKSPGKRGVAGGEPQLKAEPVDVAAALAEQRGAAAASDDDGGLGQLVAEMEAALAQRERGLREAEAFVAGAPAASAAARAQLPRLREAVRMMARVLADVRAGIELRPSNCLVHVPASSATQEEAGAAADVVCVDGGSDQEATADDMAASVSPPPLEITPQQASSPPLQTAALLPFSSAAGGAFATPDDIAPLAAAAGRTPLHYEILELMRHSTPSEETLDDIARVLDAVNEAIAPVLPGAHAVLFGSLPSGLALPVSDIDVVIVEDRPSTPLPTAAGYEKGHRPAVANQLRKVSEALMEAGLHAASTAFLIDKARVPLLKTRLTVPGSGRRRRVFADICLGVVHGTQAVALAREQVRRIKPLRPLLIFLKAFLKQRSLNESHQGGLSSFSLLNMVIAHLQEEHLAPPVKVDDLPELEYGVPQQLAFPRQLAAEAAADTETMLSSVCWDVDVGALALRFLQRFGSAFDLGECGVSIRLGGVVPASHIKPPAAANARRHIEPAGGIALEDPQQHGVSIGSCVNMKTIAHAFDYAHRILTAATEKWNEGVLEPVSDAWLRQMAEQHANFHQPGQTGPRSRLRQLQELPPPPVTLMLGRVVSLDSNLGPQTPPYNLMREALAEFNHMHG
eukprot:jgi/Ulvmu1/2810/UM142_0008.1